MHEEDLERPISKFEQLQSVHIKKTKTMSKKNFKINIDSKVSAENFSI